MPAPPPQHIDLSAGSDERAAMAAFDGPVRLITNGEHSKEGRVQKRKGFDLLATVDDGSNDDARAAALVTNGRALAVARALSSVPVTPEHGLADDTDSQHGMPGLSIAGEFEVSDAGSLPYGQVAVTRSAGGQLYACVAAQRVALGTTDTLVSITEVATGTVVRRDVLPSADLPRVVAVGTRFIVCYQSVSANNLVPISYQLDADFTRTVGSVIDTATASTHYDLWADSSSTFLIAYFKAPNTTLHVKRCSTALAVTASGSTLLAATVSRVTVTTDSIDGSVHCMVVDAALATTELITFAPGLGAVDHGPTSIGSFTLPTFAAAVHLTGTTALAFVVSVDAGTIYGRISVAHASLGAGATLESVHAHSKPVGHYYGADARALVAFRHQGDTDDDYYPTLYLGLLPLSDIGQSDHFSTSGYEPVGQLLTDAHHRDTTLVENWYPAPWAYDSTDGDYYLAVARSTGFVDGASASAVQSVIRVSPQLGASSDVTLRSATRAPRVRFGNGGVYFGGAMLSFYDGLNHGEQVPMPPQAVTTAQGVGSNLAAGNYSYCVVLAWEDELGELHRSAPSQVVTRAHAGTNGVVVTCDAHFATQLDRLDGTGTWRAELYRTIDDGATFYFHSYAEVYPNDDVTFSEDTATDAVMQLRPQLYTTGNELANEPPPVPYALCAHRGRVFGISAQDRRTVFYSKPKVEGISLEFNGVNKLLFDDELTALASLDDKLVVFTARDAFVVLGEGPDAFNEGAFSPPERVAAACGASGPHAVQVIPAGVLVHSAAGFKLLDRGLGVADVDYLAESFPATNVVAASCHFPARSQVWFVASDLGIAVFSYAYDKLRAYYWELAGDTAADGITDVEEVSGVPYLLVYRGDEGNTELYKQSTTDYDDNGVFVALGLNTGWFRPSGALGEARFRQLLLLAEYLAADDADLDATCYLQRTHEQSTVCGDFRFDQGAAALLLMHRRGRLKYQKGLAARVELLQVAGATANTAGAWPLSVAWDVAPGGPAKSGGSLASFTSGG